MTREGAGREVDGLRSWHDDWTGLSVAVLGLGKTGFSVADTLAELGAKPHVIAQSHDDERERILEVLDVPVTIADSDESAVDALRALEADLIVASPGFAPSHPLIVAADALDAPVWGDVELAWRLRDKFGDPAPWLAVTGTNGKTTTTQLAAHMGLAAGIRTAPCGNIGVPVLDVLRDPAEFQLLVVELSSFQLHSLHSMSAHAAVVLNIADDHLDWHGGAEAYRAAKGRVYERAQIACVYNKGDEATLDLVEAADVVEGCRAIGFGTDVPGPSDFGVVDGILVDRAFLDDRARTALELTTLEELRPRGLSSKHLVEDVLAAAALVRAVGVPVAAISEALSTFSVDRHRHEIVAEAAGVLWVDDSKATNVHAADASLAAHRSVVWLVGGLLKGVDIAPLVAKHAGRLRGAVALGTSRSEVANAFAQHAPEVAFIEIDVSDTDSIMGRAVAEAARLAQDGDTVLLAPAAASMDQFVSYSDRGQRFALAVASHLEGGRHAETEGSQDRTSEPDASAE